MSGNALRLMRSLAGVAGIVAFGVLLSGCAVFGNRPEPGSTGHLSLKDQLTPTAAAYAAPTVTKVSNVVPTRPISPPHADAKGEAPGSAIGCASTDGCLARLKALLDDPSRKWVGRPQSPDEHTDGTRQFAYRALRKELSCKELALAIDE